MDNEVDPIIRKAVEAAGGPAVLADRLGIQSPSLYSWRRIPPNRVLAVEAATGISRHKLRPDLYPLNASGESSTPAAPAAPPPPDKLAREAQRQFADALRKARLQYGSATGQGELTQHDFARMLGIDGERPEERYRLYEAAKREPPLWILAALRRVTGYSLDGLIAQLPAGRPLPREQTAHREAAE